MSNDEIIKAVVEITSAKMYRTEYPPSETLAADVAKLMQAIYDKLIEFNSRQS